MDPERGRTYTVRTRTPRLCMHAHTHMHADSRSRVPVRRPKARGLEPHEAQGRVDVGAPAGLERVDVAGKAQLRCVGERGI